MQLETIGKRTVLKRPKLPKSNHFEGVFFISFPPRERLNQP
jgi:hypothetical protein